MQERREDEGEDSREMKRPRRERELEEKDDRGEERGMKGGGWREEGRVAGGSCSCHAGEICISTARRLEWNAC